MAHKKAGGTAKNLRDSQPKYLGVKLFEGETAQPGSIIVRQRGTRYQAGANTALGKDHTIFSLASGTVKFREQRKENYDGRSRVAKVVEVI